MSTKRPASGGKAAGGKRPAAGGQRSAGRRKPQQRSADDEIDSDDSADEEAAQHARMVAEEEEGAEAEAAPERRVRLAKEMIAAMDAAHSRRASATAGASGVVRGAHEEDAVADALEEDMLRRSGQWRSRMAASLRGATIAPADVRRLRGPRLSPTCVAVAPDESFVVCGCKDGALVKWALPGGEASKLRGGRAAAFHEADAMGGAADELTMDAIVVGGANGGSEPGGANGARSRRRPATPVRAEFALAPTGHLSDVLAVSVSADGRLIASGGRDALLLWDVRTDQVVHQFKGHQGPINALACRRDPADALGGAPACELYSASNDRTARVWDLHQRGYVETLYGHQQAITCLDALCDQLVLSGSEDRTVRMWKVADETQLLFANGHSAPIDACALLHAEAFVSGGQDGTLAFWSAKRKKPIVARKLAHGRAPWGGPCWVSALAAPAYADVAISGSCDGYVRLWGCDEAERSLTPLCAAPVPGFVNGLALAPSGRFVACAVGQEHRLGRWFKLPDARNSLCLVTLPAAMHTAQR